MCKELCGQVYEDYKAGKIGWVQFRDYHNERVLDAMRADNQRGAGGPVMAFLDYKDGGAEIVTGAVKPQPQPERTVDTGYFDGACEPRNPGGAMGWGWTLHLPGDEGAEGKGYEAPAPSNTNNIAEYRALIALLDAYIGAAGQGPLHVYGDSMLVVRQVNQDWACRGFHLQVLLKHVHEQLRQIPGGVILRHVPRHENAAADALSVAALAEHGIKRTAR